MRAIKKYPVRRLTRVLRDAYRLEPMEPRVLLSADPVLGAAQAILIPNIDHDQALLGAYDLDDAHQYHDLVTPALVQQIRADQAQAQEQKIGGHKSRGADILLVVLVVLLVLLVVSSIVVREVSDSILS